MNSSRLPVIRMLSDDKTATPLDDSAVFVGGPLDGMRRTINIPRERIATDGGVYRRSVHCADDGAVRYVFEDETDPSDATRET